MTGFLLRGLFAPAAALLAFLLGAGYAAFIVGPPMGAGVVRAVAIDAAAVPLDRTDPARMAVGRLRYLGGLSLRSPDRGFGGLSGLLYEANCGRLLAVTDVGSWIILEPEEAGDRLVGIRAGFVAPILDGAGRPPDRKHAADAEALMRDPLTGDMLVWFELDHRAQRYRDLSACAPESLATAAHATDRPDAIRQWRSSRGVEAAAPDGRGILLLSEGAPAGDGHLAAVRIEAGRVTALRYPASGGSAATAVGELAPGSHLLLQRRMPVPRGFAATLSLMQFDSAGTARLREIARLEYLLTVDNMEGLAVRKVGGRTFVYLVSDNNFNPLQRTILMKFELLPE